MASAVDPHPHRLVTFLRHALSGSRDRIAGTIYGTILVMAVLAAGADNGTIDAWELDVLMISTVLVLWLAHVYAHAIAESITSGVPLQRRAVTGIARRASISAVR